MRVFYGILFFTSVLLINCSGYKKYRLNSGETTNIKYLNLEFVLNKSLNNHSSFKSIVKKKAILSRRIADLKNKNDLVTKKELNKLKKDLIYYDSQLNEIKGAVYRKIHLVVRDYSNKNDIKHVFNLNDNIIFYNKDDDITVMILNQLKINERLSSPAYR